MLTIRCSALELDAPIQITQHNHYFACSCAVEERNDLGPSPHIAPYNYSTMYSEKFSSFDSCCLALVMKKALYMKHIEYIYINHSSRNSSMTRVASFVSRYPCPVIMSVALASATTPPPAASSLRVKAISGRIAASAWCVPNRIQIP